MLFAANGSVIRWGDSFRGYGLPCLAIILTSLAIWRLIETPKMRSRLLGFCASVLGVTAGFQTTEGGAPLVVRRVVASFAAGKPKSALVVLLVGLVTMLSVTP